MTYKLYVFIGLAFNLGIIYLLFFMDSTGEDHGTIALDYSYVMMMAEGERLFWFIGLAVALFLAWFFRAWPWKFHTKILP